MTLHLTHQDAINRTGGMIPMLGGGYVRVCAGSVYGVLTAIVPLG